jgi:hypothetical protein
VAIRTSGSHQQPVGGLSERGGRYSRDAHRRGDSHALAKFGFIRPCRSDPLSLRSYAHTPKSYLAIPSGAYPGDKQGVTRRTRYTSTDEYLYKTAAQSTYRHPTIRPGGASTSVACLAWVDPRTGRRGGREGATVNTVAHVGADVAGAMRGGGFDPRRAAIRHPTTGSVTCWVEVDAVFEAHHDGSTQAHA